MIWLFLACSTPTPEAAPTPEPAPVEAPVEDAPPAGRIGGEPILSTPVVLGAIDNQVVLDGVEALDLGPCATERKGKVLVQFILSPGGTVHQQKVLATSLRDPVAEQCLLDTLGTARFPELEAGVKALVKYPFSF